MRCICEDGYHEVGLACLPDGADGDGDSDIDIDSDADSDGDCGWPCDVDDPERPLLRLTSIQFEAPPALASPLLQAILDDTLDSLFFVWLLELDLAADRITTGSGRATRIPPRSDDDFCAMSWNPDYPPVSGSIDHDIDIDTLEPLGRVDIPIYGESTGEPLLMLPLSAVEIHDALFDYECSIIGERCSFGDWGRSSCWGTTGTLEAWIGWEDSQEVYIEDLGRTLCTLLCGMECYSLDSPDDCRTPPGTIHGTDIRAYRMVASIGAAPVILD